jgi:lysophospholipid acyltransferase (LPLAT)-like uncharacterized protein
MKIRHPFLIKLCGILIAWAVRLWLATVRYRHCPVGRDHTPYAPDLPGRFIYAFWHEDMLVIAHQYAKPDVHVLISRHADGQIIAEAVKRLGLKVVTGSSTRGGLDALLQMKELARRSHLVFTPDGPRGPRQKVQIGIVYTAARTGLPIVPIGLAYSNAWRARSWDRLALPKPFSRAVGVTLPPIHVPHVEDREQLEVYRQQIEAALHEAGRLARLELTGASEEEGQEGGERKRKLAG